MPGHLAALGATRETGFPFATHNDRGHKRGLQIPQVARLQQLCTFDRALNGQASDPCFSRRLTPASVSDTN